MAAPAVIRSGVGFRHCQVLAIAADGYPAATTSLYYEGVQISGAKSLVITDPEPQRFAHAGDDRVHQQDVLPPTEAMSGTITTSKTNDTLDALLTGNLSFDVGQAMMFGIGTDNRGDEKQVILLAYRQTLDTSGGSSDGARRWEFRLFPKAFVVPLASGFEESTPEARTYGLYPQFIAKHAWGADFSTASGEEGFDRAQGLRGISVYKPRLVGFNGFSTDQTYVFNTSYPAADTSKVMVWIDGSQEVPDVVTVTHFILSTTTPADDSNVVCFYEVE